VDSALKELGGINATSCQTQANQFQVVKRTYIKETMAPDAVEVSPAGVRDTPRPSITILKIQRPDARLFERWVFPDDELECDWGVSGRSFPKGSKN